MEQKLITVVATALGVPASTLGLDTGPGDLEAWDSMGQINIISEIEAAFGVSIPIEKVADIHRIRDFLVYVEKKP
jgi:acyl carrier protein